MFRASGGPKNNKYFTVFATRPFDPHFRLSLSPNIWSLRLATGRTGSTLFVDYDDSIKIQIELNLQWKFNQGRWETTRARWMFRRLRREESFSLMAVMRVSKRFISQSLAPLDTQSPNYGEEIDLRRRSQRWHLLVDSQHQQLHLIATLGIPRERFFSPSWQNKGMAFSMYSSDATHLHSCLHMKVIIVLHQLLFVLLPSTSLWHNRVAR